MIAGSQRAVFERSKHHVIALAAGVLSFMLGKRADLGSETIKEALQGFLRVIVGGPLE